MGSNYRNTELRKEGGEKKKRDEQLEEQRMKNQSTY